MDTVYKIENISVFDTKSYKCIIIQGFCFNEIQHQLKYMVYANDIQLLTNVQYINRKDVLEKYRNRNINLSCGFYIRAEFPVNLKLETVKLKVLGESIEETILNKCSNELIKFITNRTMEYAIDFYRYQENGSSVIQGWVVSHGEIKNVDITLTDEDGNEIEATIIPKKRDDLLHLNIVDMEHLESGFEILFEAKPRKKYIVCLTNGDETISLKVKDTRRKDTVKHYLSIIKKYLHLKYLRKGITSIRKYGIKEAVKRVLHPGYNLNEQYPYWYEKHKADKKQLMAQAETVFEYQPKISVIVPTFNTPMQYLHEMITSVLNQSYQNFELCIADGSTDDSVVKVIREYAEKDSRIIYCTLEKNYGIAGNTNKALELATGEYIGLFDHDDLLTPDCLFEVVSALQKKKHDIIYTDEDKTDSFGSVFSDPNFKPDFNLDLFCSHNYITHFFVVKHSLITEIGGFRSEFDGSQDYDLMFRCIEKAESIYHIPKILYHWRIHEDSTAGNPASKMYCYEAGRKAIEEHYQRVGVKAKVEIMDLWGMYHTIYETPGNPLVSILIPNKDQIDLLENCLNSIYTKSEYRNFEVIIIENNSNDNATFDFYKKLENKYDNLHIVFWKNDFNYSSINNFGASFAKGDFLLLLNNDTEMLSETAISEMVGCCMRDEVGIVGAKLLYDDNTVQHAGIVIGFGGFAGHVFTGIGKDDLGFMVRARINCDYSAVTAACMMVKKNVYDEVKGLSEEFKVALNDVDFCLKVRKLDKLVVFNAFSLWYHYESKSRGYEDTPEKKKRFDNEVKLFQEKWADILREGDPYYNKNFPVELGPFVLDTI